MQNFQGSDVNKEWSDKPVAHGDSVEDVTKKLGGLSVGASSAEKANVCAQTNQPWNLQVKNQVHVASQKAIWKSRSYGTVTEATDAKVEEKQVGKDQKNSDAFSKFLSGNLLEGFKVDTSTYAQAQIRATFYPKFENEKSDQEVFFYIFFTFSLTSFDNGISNQLID